MIIETNKPTATEKILSRYYDEVIRRAKDSPPIVAPAFPLNLLMSFRFMKRKHHLLNSVVRQWWIDYYADELIRRIKANDLDEQQVIEMVNLDTKEMLRDYLKWITK
jgi:hypothetical protein